MKRLNCKLSSRRGDTLVEVLVSILVAGLSVALLVGMIATGTKFNAKARASDDALYQELSAAEGRSASLGRETLTLTVGGEEYRLTVEVYGAEDGLTSYAKEGSAP